MWSDLLRLFTYAFTKDPISKRKSKKNLPIAGVTIGNDPALDLRNASGDGFSSNTGAMIRVQNDLIDITSTSNRQNRLKEYERLDMGCAEIAMCLNVVADEMCVAGSTKIATLLDGYKTIKELSEKNADDRFPVYCYSFAKNDITISWAYDPRKVKYAATVRIVLSDGNTEIVTPDHKILLRDGTWKMAGDLKYGDELMPFYKVLPNRRISKSTNNQYPRILTFGKSWVHERQLIDEWRYNEDLKEYEKANSLIKCIANGLTVAKTSKIAKCNTEKVSRLINEYGMPLEEIHFLQKKYKNSKKVIDVHPHAHQDVYDISVENHHNFCTNNIIMHNCQRDDEGRPFKIKTSNEKVKKELEHLFFNRNELNFNSVNLWDKARRLCLMGDEFWELIIDPDNPKAGVQDLKSLPADSMYRIESTKGKLLEFQQGKEGPDLQALTTAPVATATDTELAQANAVRFAPEQVVHLRIGDFKRTFYPYGVSLVEPGKNIAYELLLMTDAMVCYRLARSTERRVFYIDIGQMPAYKAEQFVERLKDQYKKRKVPRHNGAGGGTNSVEERYHFPAVDEDFYVPIRPGSQTKIETLPGACLSLDTIIPLLDGRELSLTEIIKEYNEGKQNWAYSCNPETGKPAPGKITWAGVTRKNTEVMKITLDNNESVVCTPDHKFPLLYRGNVEAKDLKVGDSMIPFNTRTEKIFPMSASDYHQVYDVESKKWVFTHRFVANDVKNTIYENYHIFNESYKNAKRGVIHHMNYNRFDNNPENLFWMNWDDHKLLHKIKTPETKQNISKGLRKFHDKLDSSDPFYDRIRECAKIGLKNRLFKLKNDEEYRNIFSQKMKDMWKRFRLEKPESYKIRGSKISRSNVERMQNEEYKRNIFEKQTIVYCEDIFNFFVELLKEGYYAEEIMILMNDNQEIIDLFKSTNKHIVRDIPFLFTMEHYRKMVKFYGYKTIHALKKSLNPKKKERPFTVRKLIFPKIIFDKYIDYLKQDLSNDEIIPLINQNKDLMNALKDVNKGNHHENIKKLTKNQIYKMFVFFGYKNIEHIKQDINLYNHRIIKIEYLEEKIDTGTLTIDGNHEIHNYHNFALKCGIYTKNSNLQSIDDSIWYANRLFMSFGIPPGYFATEDIGSTRISLSAQNIKFAKMIERLQSPLENGIWHVSDRHLQLIGMPEEAYEDLEIVMTPPSDWRELSRAEIVTNRINNASSLKSSQLYPDYDVLTKILKHTPEEADEIIARMKIQKLEELKIQILAQNPNSLGVGMPSGAEQEIGAEPGGPNPTLGGEQPPPEEGRIPQEPPMESGKEEANELPFDSKQTKSLPEPTEEEIIKFDMEIQDYETDQDSISIDYSELNI